MSGDTSPDAAKAADTSDSRRDDLPAPGSAGLGCDMHLALFSIDHADDTWEVSPQFSELLRLSPDEPLSWARLLELVDAADRDSLAAAIRAVGIAGSNGDFECNFRLAGDQPAPVWVRCQWHTQFDNAQNPVRSVGALFDISSSLATYSALYDRKIQLRSILEAAVDAIITIDGRGIIQSANRATERLFGYTQKELLGENVKLLMPAPFRDEHDGYLARYRESGEAHIIGIGREVVAQRKDGSTFPVDLAVSEIDHLGMFTGIVRDITKRKQAEDLLRGEREFTQKILDTARALIVVGDMQGKVLRVNRHFELISGFRQDQLVGRPCLDVLAPHQQRDDAKRQLDAALSGMSDQGAVHAMPTHDGQMREVAWWHTPLTDDNGKVVGLVCAGRDMTEFKQLQDKLVQSERLAALGEAMAGLAHESRNALQRSQVCLDLLSGRAADDPESLELLDSIQLSMDDLNRLYEEVRAYAAPIHVAPERCHLGEIVRQAWESQGASRKDRAVHFEEHISCDLYCDVDAFAMGRVFCNIFENSLQACGDTIEIHVTYSDANSDGRPLVRIAVRDNGPGIAAKDCPAVFDSFFTTKSQGTGLGMAIARRVVDAHGGRIEVNPNCPAGAEFIVTLPRFHK